MLIQITTTAKQIARALNNAGISTHSHVTEPDENVDGMIKLDDSIHVQVGAGYANVVREVKMKFYFGASRTNTDDLIRDIRKLRESVSTPN